MQKRTCSIDGCNNGGVITRTWCGMHYSRFLRKGSATAKVNIIGDDTARFWSKVEKTDSCWNWTGTKSNGYGRMDRTKDGISKQYLVHRVSFEMNNGPIPDGKVIDHICHNTLCVRPEHLQAVTQKQNTENRQGPSKRSTTGALGVWLNKRNQRWEARVVDRGIKYNVGSFGSVEEANEAVKAKRNELFTNNLIDRAGA